MARRRFRVKIALIALAILLTAISGGAQLPANYVAGSTVQLNDNGAWSWFLDERVIVDKG